MYHCQLLTDHFLFDLPYACFRFKKSGQNDAKLKGELATLQRDSRPLLYKFHEVCLHSVDWNLVHIS